MKTTKLMVMAQKQPVKFFLFKVKQNFYFCRFVKILTKLRPCIAPFEPSVYDRCICNKQLYQQNSCTIVISAL